MVNLILNKDKTYAYEAYGEQLTSASEVKKQKRSHQATNVNNLKSALSPDLQRAMEVSQEKGASNWLTVLPVEEHGFALHMPSGMQLLFDTVGFPVAFPCHAPVGQTSRLSMPYPVLKEDIPPLDTMKSEPTSCR